MSAPIYADDAVELHHGEALALLHELDSESVDAVVTDPPYSSGGQFRGDRAGQSTNAKYVQTGTIAERPDFSGDNRDQRGYAYWCALWMSEALRVTRPGGSLLVFTDWRQLPTTTDAVQAGGWVWRGIIAWDKTEVVRPRSGFASQCEYVVWATAGPMREDYAVYLPGVLRTPSPRGAARIHITEKPIELMRRLAEIAPRGGVILDPFAGSGSTLRGAKDTGRRAIGFELNERFCRVAAERCLQEALPLADDPPPREIIADRLELEDVETIEVVDAASGAVLGELPVDLA